LRAGAVVDQPRRLSVADVRRDPRLFAILLEHALRGVRVQQLLRAVLVVFVTATVIAVPPAHYRTGCYVTVALYAASAVGIGWVSLRGGERAIRLVWLALFVDLLALGVLSVLASQSEQSWTADVLVNGFFVVPMLAGTQLRPSVAAAVAAPAVAIYLGSLIAAQNANAEPSASIVLRTVALAGLSVACVLLSSIQRSRVLTIAALADDRTRLLGELVDVESRARGTLAEELHDGALQYLLAARQDVDDARRGDATSLDRVDLALRESAALLRAKVSQLHPAVLEQAGLLHALRELVRTTAERGELDIELVAEGLDESTRSPADYLLYSAARELLTNVTKHAHAHTVKIALQRHDGHIRLTVADDGTGIEERVLEQRLAEGHVGVSSQRVRVMAAGGSFHLRRGERGTVGEVELPLEGH
jgi:two-component system, NarL family, sensor kinase